MNHRNQPQVSLGLPVYQGENFLRGALDSLLAQSFTDFEIIISDNASTDATAEICRDYAKRDERVSYIRQQTNLGAARNYNVVFEESRGRMFKWAAHDDVCLPDFLSECMRALDEHPEAVLAYPLHEIIDSDGKIVGSGAKCPEAASSSTRARVRAALAPDESAGEPPWSVFGVMRREALERTRLHGSYVGSDRTLMVELALLGPFVEVDKRLFLNREHPTRSIRKFTGGGIHPRSTWFDSRQAGRLVFPNWRRLRELVTAVFRTSISRRDQIASLGVILAWVGRGNWKRLVRDVYVALIMILWPSRRPR